MNRIKALRKGKGLSQDELARVLNLHQTAVSQWETGKTSPDMSVIPALSAFFNVTADYILGISDEKQQKKEPAPYDELAQNETVLSLATEIMELPPEAQDKVLDYVQLLKK